MNEHMLKFVNVIGLSFSKNEYDLRSFVQVSLNDFLDQKVSKRNQKVKGFKGLVLLPAIMLQR